MAWRVLMNSALISASDADVTTLRIIFAMLSTAPLLSGYSELSDMKKCPPDLLLAFGSDRYESSLWRFSTMSLAV